MSEKGKALALNGEDHGCVNTYCAVKFHAMQSREHFLLTADTKVADQISRVELFLFTAQSQSLNLT